MSSHQVLQEVKLYHTKPDLKVWTLCKDEKFTMKSCTIFIHSIECSGSCSFQIQVWKSVAPPKIQTFIWLVIQHKLCIRSFLFCWHLSFLDQSCCPFYLMVIKSSNHILIHCQFNGIYEPIFFRGEGSIRVFHTYLISCYINDQWWLKALELLSSGIPWSIWLIRNNLVFNDVRLDLDLCFSLTLHRLST
jgi:hypothetical protein